MFSLPACKLLKTANTLAPSRVAPCGVRGKFINHAARDRHRRCFVNESYETHRAQGASRRSKKKHATKAGIDDRSSVENRACGVEVYVPMDPISSIKLRWLHGALHDVTSELARSR